MWLRHIEPWKYDDKNQYWHRQKSVTLINCFVFISMSSYSFHCERKKKRMRIWRNIPLTNNGILKWKRICFHSRHFKSHANVLFLTPQYCCFLWLRGISHCVHVTSHKFLQEVFVVLWKWAWVMNVVLVWVRNAFSEKLLFHVGTFFTCQWNVLLTNFCDISVHHHLIFICNSYNALYFQGDAIWNEMLVIPSFEPT